MNRFSIIFCYSFRFSLLPIPDARCRRIKSTFSLSIIFYMLSEIHEMLLTNTNCTLRWDWLPTCFTHFGPSQMCNFNFIRFPVNCTTKMWMWHKSRRMWMKRWKRFAAFWMQHHGSSVCCQHQKASSQDRCKFICPMMLSSIVASIEMVISANIWTSNNFSTKLFVIISFCRHNFTTFDIRHHRSSNHSYVRFGGGKGHGVQKTLAAQLTPAMAKCLHFNYSESQFQIFTNSIFNFVIFCFNAQGKGYPDTNTRLILAKLRELHTLPIHVFTDADPYGIEIMLTYRHGSLVRFQPKILTPTEHI